MLSPKATTVWIGIRMTDCMRTMKIGFSVVMVLTMMEKAALINVAVPIKKQPRRY